MRLYFFPITGSLRHKIVRSGGAGDGDGDGGSDDDGRSDGVGIVIDCASEVIDILVSMVTIVPGNMLADTEIGVVPVKLLGIATLVL